jgi:hypothetical protein
MGIFDFMRKKQPPSAPDVADLLVLLGLVASAKDYAHAFYQKHYAVIDEAIRIVAKIGSHHEGLARHLRLTMTTLPEMTAKIRGALDEAFRDDEVRNTLNQEMEGFLSGAVRLLQDPSCPDLLRQCLWMLNSGALIWTPISQPDDQTGPAGTAPGRLAPP